MLGWLEWRWLAGIYSPQPPTTVGGGCCRWAHRTVRCASHVTQPLGFGHCQSLEALSSSGTGQFGATPDMHCSLSGAPLTSVLTSAVYCSAVKALCNRPLRWRVVAPLGAPDSLVNYSGARPEKPEGEEFVGVRS
jgi:hypothetical protein